MANNLIQIKRSAATATPASLAAGELAFSNVTGGSGVLFIGSTDGATVVPIGGVRNPGVLTANQALVANTTSGINQIQVGNLAFVGTTQTITANGSTGTAGYVLTSGGSGANVYWVSSGSLGVNAAAQYNWTNTHTWFANLQINSTSLSWIGNTTTSPTVSFSNSGVIQSGNTSVTAAPQLIIANTLGTTTVNSNYISTTTVGGNLVGTYVSVTTANATTFNGTTINANLAGSYVSVTTANATTFNGTTVNANLVGSYISVTTANATTVNANLVGSYISVTTANATTFNGTTVNANLAGSYVSVTTANATTFNGTTINANLSGTYVAVTTANATTFNSGANLYVNSTAVSWTGNTTTSPTITLANTGSFTIGNSSTTQTGSIITVANSTGNVQITPSGISGNGVNITTINATNITVGTLPDARLSSAVVNTSGSFTLAGNTTLGGTSTTISSNLNVTGTFINVASAFIANSTGAYHTGLMNAASFNAGAIGTGTGGSVQNTTTMFVGNNTINTVITSAGLAVNGTATIANSTGVYTGVVNGSSITVGTSFIANSTKVTFTGANIDATSAFLKVADAVISGNLTVSGTVTTIDTQQLTVNDNIIILAKNNTTTDAVDTGWFSPAGNATNIWYSGFARQAAKSSNSAPYFWLFGSNTNPNTATTVDTSANSSTAFLQAYLVPYGTGGAFVANSTVVNITANATVSSTLTVNSITLTTALAATSGGTGQTSYATGDLLYASSTTALSKLGVPGSAANGQVLQITNNLPAYGTLDGGTF